MRFLLALVVTSFCALGLVAVAQVTPSSEQPQHRNQIADQEDMMTQDGMRKHMQAMNKMMVQQLGKHDDEYDRRFIEMMIPHHEGAVMMAKDTVKYAKHQELRDMAAKIIKDQQKEIEQLKAWRQKWYGDNTTARR